jgi:hypothetical protein
MGAEASDLESRGGTTDSPFMHRFLGGFADATRRSGPRSAESNQATDLIRRASAHKCDTLEPQQPIMEQDLDSRRALNREIPPPPSDNRGIGIKSLQSGFQVTAGERDLQSGVEQRSDTASGFRTEVAGGMFPATGGVACVVAPGGAAGQAGAGWTFPPFARPAPQTWNNLMSLFRFDGLSNHPFHSRIFPVSILQPNGV